jgi:adenylate cyclase
VKNALTIIALRFRRTWPVMLLLSVLGTGFACAWWFTDALEISDDERGAYDDGLKAFTLPKRALLQWVQERTGLGKPRQSTDVVVITLDDQTMTAIADGEGLRARYGRSVPYDRVIWADLVTYLSKVGARAVIFDMVMNEESADGAGDRALADALDAADVPVLLGFNTSAIAPPLPAVEATAKRPVGKRPSLEPVAEDDFPVELTAEEQATLARQLAAQRLEWAAKAYALPVTMKGGLAVPPFPAEAERRADGTPTGKELAHAPMAAMPRALESFDGFGTVTAESDEDGKLRRTAFVYTDGVNTYPTLPVAALVALERAEGVTLEPGRLTVGGRTVRINPDGTAEIHFGGTLKDRFRTLPLIDALNRYHFCVAREGKSDQVAHDCPGGDLAADPESAFLRGKVVFVGTAAVGADEKATPFEQEAPGVIKQAAVLDNLLRDEFILAAPLWASVSFAFLVALFSVALVLVVRNTFIDIAWPVLLYVGFFAVTGSFLVATRIHVLSALPGLAGTVASILATTWERLFARRERERLKELFQNYMESELVELMVEQKQLPNLEGENLDVTAFFSDIKGFSTFSELLKDEPKRLMGLINRYLSTVTPLITAQGACIDKYIGDAVVALFGAPVAYADHPLRACRAALDVQRAIGALREALRKEGLPDVYTRIGLNTGKMMVGNIGSAQLLDYTAIGDEMNLAARLEGANKNYGTLIMMGAGTWGRVKNDVEARELDLVRVAGKTQAVAVYELLALRGELAPEKRKVVDLYAKALVAYRARGFDDARRFLGEALLIDRTDGPCQRLFRLCEEYLVHPPPEGWDGVSNLEK